MSFSRSQLNLKKVKHKESDILEQVLIKSSQDKKSQ